MSITSTHVIKLYKVKMGAISIVVTAFNVENSIYRAYKLAKGSNKGSNEGLKKFRKQITDIEEMFSIDPNGEDILI